MDSWIRKRYANTLANPKTPKHCSVYEEKNPKPSKNNSPGPIAPNQYH